MVTIRIEDLDRAVVTRLAERAAEHGQSLEAEMRAVLSAAVAEDAADDLNLAQAIHAQLAVGAGPDVDTGRRPDPPRLPWREQRPSR